MTNLPTKPAIAVSNRARQRWFLDPWGIVDYSSTDDPDLCTVLMSRAERSGEGERQRIEVVARMEELDRLYAAIMQSPAVPRPRAQGDLFAGAAA